MPHALVVDDNPTILLDATDILEDAGFEVFTAYDTHQAVRQLEARGDDISLLFTDVELPGHLDGFDLARLAATHWTHMRILVASGQMKPKDGDLPDGAVFVGKPFSAAVVHTRLHEILAEHQKPEALRQIRPIDLG